MGDIGSIFFRKKLNMYFVLNIFSLISSFNGELSGPLYIELILYYTI